MAFTLENCVMSRSMPKGYTWEKYVKCWTGDPALARFFEPRVNESGEEEMRAAYFTSLLVYDSDSGWTEREVKFQGNDALWAVLELREQNQIALVSCEGHVFTKVIEDQVTGESFVRTTTMIKQGTITCFEFDVQSEPITIGAQYGQNSESSVPSEDNQLGLEEWL